MGYHSIIYIFLFLPVCLLAYQLAPEKWRGRVLLAFSWIFFYLLSGKLLVYLLGTTLLTHCIGIWLTLLKTEEAKAVEGMDRKQKKVIKAEYQKKGRRVLILGILILLGVLGYLKYFDFFTTNLSYLFGHPVLEGWRPEKAINANWNFILYIAGNWLYDRCILGNHPGRDRNLENRIVSSDSSHSSGEGTNRKIFRCGRYFVYRKAIGI